MPFECLFVTYDNKCQQTQLYTDLKGTMSQKILDGNKN